MTQESGFIKKPIVIVPTYNERENVSPLVERVFSASSDIHILFVDDNSQDGTQLVIESMMAKNPDRIFILKRAGKLGLGTAYIAGFKWALAKGYDALIEMDADHSHDPKELPIFIQKLQTADAVIGSRYIEGGATVNWSFIRKCISIFGSFYGRTILGISIRDLTGGFNAWRKDTIVAINPDLVKSEGYSFQIELKYRAFRAGKKLVESPITFEERRAGQSKMSFRIVLEAMTRVWALRSIK
ncbi:MAG: polyprenol monophosphomannose synthase [Proteobacteria bacterium]|nr:polyprenol monophosphomannose synthase [Pseudomonadota bacterium]